MNVFNGGGFWFGFVFQNGDDYFGFCYFEFVLVDIVGGNFVVFDYCVGCWEDWFISGVGVFNQCLYCFGNCVVGGYDDGVNFRQYLLGNLV